MSETKQLGLPLVQAAQAQKHVTVNEALVRLDAAAALSVEAWELPSPPGSPVEGGSYLIGAPASGEWAGREQELAIYSNGGWVYLTPKTGWRAWNTEISAPVVFDGVVWARDTAVFSPGGAKTNQRIIEIDHTITAGASSGTGNVIPSHAQVVGVTARVITAITGTGVSSWSLGISGDTSKYASGLGLSLNSFALGPAGSPETYWADTELVLTPDAGSFTDGAVRIGIHVIELVPPRAV